MTTNGKQLARPGDPLATIQGELLEPDDDGDSGGLAASSLPLPSTPVPYSAYRPQTRRVMSDFREPKALLNACAVIFSYSVLGISDAEICEATGLDMEQIESVRSARAYSEMFQNVMRELINANSEYIEARIAAYSGMALNNVADIAASAKNKAVKLSASKDLLDRAGHRPQDQASKGSSGMNELHIVITKAKDDDTVIEFGLGGQKNGHSS